MSNDNGILETLNQLGAQLERIEEKLDQVLETQERLEEAVANVSLPGGNFGIEYTD